MNHNILFLLRLWPFFGGGETVTICLANEFVKRGYGVHVLYFKDTDSRHGLTIDERVVAHKINGIKCDEYYCDETACNIVSSFLVNYIHNNRISIVIDQWWPVSYIQGVKEKTNAKVVKCNHTAFFHPVNTDAGIKGILKKLLWPIYLRRQKKMSCMEVEDYLPYVDKYVFLSSRFVNQYLEFGGNNKEDKINAIPNPLPYSDFSKTDKANEVLFVGRIYDSLKRLSISLNAWKEVEKNSELNVWTFVVVGDGPDLPMLKEKAKLLGLKRVKFEGFQNPEPYYERAKILVQNSSYEGFGMTIVEAQQKGCVPIAMDTFLTVHDLIKSGDNGILTLDDQNDFTQELIRLMENIPLIEKLSVRAVETSKSFSVEKVVDRWVHLFYEFNVSL